MVAFIHEPITDVANTSLPNIDERPRFGPPASPARLGRPAYPAPTAHRSLNWRKLALSASFLALPAAAGVLSGRARRRGILAAGLAALGLGTLRLELARWFRFEPAFDSDGKVGDLELRRYDARVEACIRVGDLEIERAIDHGYGRLAAYIRGANQTGELLARTTPILTVMRAGCYNVSLMMPPGRALGDLPRPDHLDIELREVPACEIAALRFGGRCTRDNVAAHERVLLRQLIAAGLSTRGSIAVAIFDSQATLPILRRNELWIEVV
jgi:hypothetical protein